MKVCLLNDSFPPVIDGVVSVLLNYADHLMADHGAQVLVGTPAYPDADYSGYGYPVVPYPSFDTASVTNGYRTGNPFSGKEVMEMAAFAPDLIHSHCPASATVIARLLREQTGAPIVFTYHTKYDVDLRREFKFEPLANEIIKAMVGNIEACDDIWTVSRGAGESLKALGFSGDYLVMPNGVDFEKGRVSQEEVERVTKGCDLPEGVPVFLYVGRLITYKGLPLILDALRILHDSGQDFRMVFVGKGPDEELLKNRALELGISEKCIFTGPIYERLDLRAWNTRADLFLFPSTFDTNGLVVREAAACGLASVLIKGSCAAEDSTDDRNGFIIEENAEAMAALLHEACRDIPHLHDVGQHAMDELYLSWKDCVSRAYDRYGYVLEQKNAGLLSDDKKLPTDHLVTMTARNMSEQDRMRQLGQRWKDEFAQYRAGMMENVQEAEDQAEAFWKNLYESLRERYQAVKNLAHPDADEMAGEEAGEETEGFWSRISEDFKKEMNDLWGI